MSAGFGKLPEPEVDSGIDIQVATGESSLPPPERLRRWVEAALEGRPGEVSLRIVDEAEIAALNARFRQRPGPTNVLSFPFDPPPGVPLTFLGDVVICAPVVVREAREQGKTEEAHWAHLIVHGVLHLRGFDHLTPEDAERMEARERAILAELGFPDPYLIEETH